jgi:hypothetical protein
MADAPCADGRMSFDGMAEGPACSPLERVEMATPADMHGRTGNLLGRRSFGGFSPSAERNWNAALRHATGQNGNGRRNSDEPSPDGRSATKRRQERPIGNLDAKLRSGSAGSRKRKKTTISDVS